MELHSFGDASERRIGAAVYAVVRKPSGNTQRLVVGKSRLAKQGLTIPRLVIAAHMDTNQLINAKVFGLLDSTVALHWIKGTGQYKQFARIQLPRYRRYVPVDEHPANLANRDAPVQFELWQQGPAWLQYRSKWPINPVTRSSLALEVEAKVIREVLHLAQTKPEPDEFRRTPRTHQLAPNLESRCMDQEIHS